MSISSPYDALWVALKKSRPIAFGLFMARMTGNPKAAILLSQLVHWSRTGTDITDRNGWLFKTQQQWWVETGLSRAELDTARRRLRNTGLIEETLAGRPATVWYRLDLSKMGQALEVCSKKVLPFELTFERMQVADQEMKDLIGPTTAYHRVLADISGSVSAGLLLSRMLQLQKHAQLGGCPWFSVTLQTWQKELGLNRRALENAKRRLKDMGLIDETLVTKATKRVFTRVDPSLLIKLLREQFNVEAEKAARSGVVGVATTRRHQASKAGLAEETGFRISNMEADRGARSPTRSESVKNLDRSKGTFQFAGKVPCRLPERYVSYKDTNTDTNTYTPTTTTNVTEEVDSVLQQTSEVVVGKLNLIWPESLAADSRSVAARVLEHIPGHSRQTVLDEYAARARRKAVENPLGYIRQLVLLERQGLFYPELAHTEVRRRSSVARINESVKRAEKAARPSEVNVVLTSTSKVVGSAHIAELKAMLAQRSLAV